MSASPGPWKVRTLTPITGVSAKKDMVYVVDEAHDRICHVSPEIVGVTDVTRANAQLIAAAPDLLKVLVELCEGGNSRGCVEGENDWWTRVHAAIAKARGGR